MCLLTVSNMQASNEDHNDRRSLAVGQVMAGGLEQHLVTELTSSAVFFFHQYWWYTYDDAQ